MEKIETKKSVREKTQEAIRHENILLAGAPLVIVGFFMFAAASGLESTWLLVTGGVSWVAGIALLFLHSMRPHELDKILDKILGRVK